MIGCCLRFQPLFERIGIITLDKSATYVSNPVSIHSSHTTYLGLTMIDFNVSVNKYLPMIREAIHDWCFEHMQCLDYRGTSASIHFIKYAETKDME